MTVQPARPLPGHSLVFGLGWWGAVASIVLGELWGFGWWLLPVESALIAWATYRRRSTWAVGAVVLWIAASGLSLESGDKTQTMWTVLAATLVRATFLIGTIMAARAVLRRLDNADALARTDAVTGLLNRRGGDVALTAELSRQQRTGEPLCLVLLDVDDFKSLNDRFGHAAGDRALRIGGQVLQESLREYDIAARWGGDEFLIVLPATHRSDGVAAATRMQSAIRNQLAASGLEMTLSAGLAACTGGVGRDRLLAAADEQLYLVKTTNKGSLAACDIAPEMPVLRPHPGSGVA